MKKWSFHIKKLWLLEVLGGCFFAIFIRWTEVLFMTRNFFAASSNWSGLAGPEYIAMLVGGVSRLGAAFFTLVSALTGGLNTAQMICVLFALGLWEWLVREVVGKKRPSADESEGICVQIGSLPFFWSWVLLFFLGWLSIQLQNVM